VKRPSPPPAPGKKPLLLRSLIAIAATAPILALMSYTPGSWWRRNGFTDYPGTFVRVSENDYRLCRPWGGARPPHKDPALRVTGRLGSVAGGEEANFAVLLPASAHIDAIYCGAAPSPAPLQECSGNRCAAAMHIIVDDGQYTRGRGVILGFEARKADPGRQIAVGFWVLWSARNPSIVKNEKAKSLF
jgi:hypothetical protein